MITVLGATGNVGSKIAKQLLAQKHKVRVVGRDSAKLAELHPGAEVKAGDINDTAFLTDALRGSTAAFVMIPPHYAVESFAEYYQKVSESIAKAIRDSGVSHVVSLSSFGAHLSEGTGPIKYLKPHEERLNRIEKVEVLHLRPTYFMENLLSNLELVQKQSIMGSDIAGDVKFPMIATQDIASAAVKRLVARDFAGKSVQELLGPREISMNEVAAIVSEVVGKQIKYITFDAESTKQALKGYGFSQNAADLFVEMGHAFSTGLIKAKRDASSTTPTKFEDFARIFQG